jgi:hypothetical protein
MPKLRQESDRGRMTWTSNAPVQINVGRDLHIHGSGSAPRHVPTAATPAPRAEFGPGLAFAVSRLCAIVWTLIKAAAWLVVAAVSLTAWTVFGTFALAVWLLGRVGNLLLIGERLCGGGPTQFVYVPSVLQRDGAQVRALESDYDCDIIDTEATTTSTVLARRTQ